MTATIIGIARVPYRRRPDSDSDVSPEEKAALIMLTAGMIAAGLTTITITDDHLEAAHHAIIWPTRIEDKLIVDVTR